MIYTKKIGSVLLGVLLFSITTYSQEQPVKWKFFTKKVSDKKYELHLTASIQPGWHIYSTNQPKESIGLPATIKIVTNPLLSLPGKPLEKGTLQKIKNEELGTIEHQYTGTVDFVRVVGVKADVKTDIIGTVEFMACTEERCLSPEIISFRVPLQ